jgi:hypothetical protein
MSAGSAPAPRTTLDLKVRVWGMGSNDQPFFQNAVAQNISATGACIYGLEQQLKVNDVIGVQYEGKKARCKVMWVTDAGGLKKTQVGVQLVADQDCPWLAVLPKDAAGDPAALRAPDNRRKFMRHKISFPLQLRDERVNTPMRANATDISGNGCYVESAMPVAVGTSLRIELWIDQESLSATATVRTRDPGVGMGIEFTGLPDDSKNRLQAHLDKLDPGITNLGRKSGL